MHELMIKQNVPKIIFGLVNF